MVRREPGGAISQPEEEEECVTRKPERTTVSVWEDYEGHQVTQGRTRGNFEGDEKRGESYNLTGVRLSRRRKTKRNKRKRMSKRR